MGFIGKPEFPEREWRRRTKADTYFVRPLGELFRDHIDTLEYINPVGWDDVHAADKEFNLWKELAYSSKEDERPAQVLRRTFSMPFDLEWLHRRVQQYGPFAQDATNRETRELSQSMVTATVFDYESVARQYLKADGRPAQAGENPEVDLAIQLEYLCWQDLILKGRRSTSLRMQFEDWYAREGGIKPCEVCGYPFDSVWQLAGYYLAGKGHHICFSCDIREHPTGDELLARIKEFVDFCGFVPKSGTDLVGVGLFDLFSADQIVDACKLYLRMGGIEYVRFELGSWFHGLVQSGVYPEGTVKTARGIKTISKDGHICLSLGELEIDNWLYDHGIPHERECKYPVHPTYNPKNATKLAGLRSDWLVGNTWIEYFGLAGDRVYDKKSEVKRALASELGLHLIAIMPKDLARLDDVLQELLDDSKPPTTDSNG